MGLSFLYNILLNEFYRLDVSEINNLLLYLLLLYLMLRQCGVEMTVGETLRTNIKDQMKITEEPLGVI